MFYYNYSPNEPQEAYPYDHWNHEVIRAGYSLTVPDFRGHGHSFEYRIILSLTNGRVTASDGYSYLAFDDSDIEAVKKILRIESGEAITQDRIIAYLKALVARVNEQAKMQPMLRLRVPLFLARVSRKSPNLEPADGHERLVFVLPPQPGVSYLPA